MWNPFLLVIIQLSLMWNIPPMERVVKFVVMNVRKMRGDEGGMEWWKINTKEQSKEIFRSSSCGMRDTTEAKKKQTIAKYFDYLITIKKHFSVNKISTLKCTHTTWCDLFLDWVGMTNQSMKIEYKPENQIGTSVEIEIKVSKTFPSSQRVEQVVSCE